MAAVKEDIKKEETKEESKIGNCSRLDSDCYLDSNAALVKKQYGCMDGQGAVDQGMMLQ